MNYKITGNNNISTIKPDLTKSDKNLTKSNKI